MRCPSCGARDFTPSKRCPVCDAVPDEATDARPMVTTRAGSVPHHTPSPKDPSDSKPGAPRSESGVDGISPGSPLGVRYTIIDRLGKGGMGVVYKAYDRELERVVALKLIREDVAEKPDALVRFRRELGLAQQVSHHNVCRVHDLGEAAGVRYMSMEFLEGQDLGELISEVGRLSRRQTLDMADQVCAGLQAIHSQGIVHRDLKPSNIGVTPSGRVAVMDFGIARRQLDLDVTAPGVLVGSYSYLAPEQIPGAQVDERTDIYCLGLLLYEMLTGLRPPGDKDATPLAFRGKDAKCRPPSQHRADTSPRLDDLIIRCLAWEPEERPQTVKEVRAILQQCRKELDRHPFTPQRETPEGAGEKKLLRSALVASALIVVMVITYIFWPHKGEESLSEGGEIARSLAVLPFQYEGDEARHAYLADMATEALTAGLQSVPQIALPPFETIRSFADAGRLEDKPLDELAGELGVEELIQGDVTVQAGQFVVAARLIASAGTIAWKGEERGATTRPLPAVERIKVSLLQNLRVSPEPSSASLSQIRTPSMEAYEKYLQARDDHAHWDIEESLEQALALYREAIGIDPDFAAAHAMLAKALVTQFYQNNDVDLIPEAAREVQIANALMPELPEVLVARGFVEEVRGNTVEAEIALKMALERAPGNDTAHRVLADFYADLGRHREAREYYERAIALRPALWRNHYAYGRYLRVLAGDLEMARQYLEKAHEYHPNGVAPKAALGNIHLQSGRLEQAEGWYRQVLENHQTPWAHYNLGVVYYYQRDYELALRSFQAALERAPEKPMFDAAVGDALRELGQREQAQSHYLRALDRYRTMLDNRPDDIETRAETGALLASLDRCEEAQAELETVLAANPDSAPFNSLGAYAASLCGDLEQATHLALQAIQLGDSLFTRFDPHLELVRQQPDVRQALERTGLTVP